MNRSSILSHLGPHPWADHLQVLEEAGSTNTLLKAMGRQGAPHGSVLIADRQTAGRGRLGRSFLSPGGVGLYCSALIRPGCPPTELMHLTCAVAVSVCDAVEAACGIRPQIKWTNDLVLNKKKLAGILTELSLDPLTHLVDCAVIGVGINCCQRPGDFDPSIRGLATSLFMALDAPIDRSHLAAELIRAMDAMSASLLTDRRAMMDRYRRDCITLGQEIQVLRGGTVRRGKAVDIDDEGGLLVEYDDGGLETVTSGEVSIRGMYGYV